MLRIGTFLGYATGDPERKAEDTITPERQQESPAAWDRGTPFPQ